MEHIEAAIKIDNEKFAEVETISEEQSIGRERQKETNKKESTWEEMVEMVEISQEVNLSESKI